MMLMTMMRMSGGKIGTRSEGCWVRKEVRKFEWVWMHQGISMEQGIREKGRRKGIIVLKWSGGGRRSSWGGLG